MKALQQAGPPREDSQRKVLFFLFLSLFFSSGPCPFFFLSFFGEVVGGYSLGGYICHFRVTTR